jgi:hypothetical protein
MEKKLYITPAIEKVQIDNQISVVLMSGSGEGIIIETDPRDRGDT